MIIASFITMDHLPESNASLMFTLHKKQTKPVMLPPNAHILVVTPASAGLLDGWEVSDRVIVLDKYLFDYPQQFFKHPANLKRLQPLWRDLRDGDYDAVLLMHH